MIRSNSYPNTKGASLRWKGLMVAGLLAFAGSASGQVLVKNNGALISITAGATVIVKTGAFDNADGTISNAGTLVIEQDFVNNDTATSGGPNGTGLYRVQQDWENNGTFIARRGTVELYGANQPITGTSVTTFYDLKLTGTGIKTQTIDANVLDSLVLNSRELATETFKMHVMNPDPGAISKAAGNQGFVSSLGAGRLAWDLDRNFTYRFPTGSSVGTGRYRPLEIRPDFNTNITMEARLANVDATTEGFNRNTKQANICEVKSEFYHLIGRTAGNDPVQLAILFDPATDGNWSIVSHWQNLPQWEDVGNVLSGTSAGFSTLTIPSWTNFTTQPFALARPQVDIDTMATLLTDASCFGDDNGAINITVNTGTPTFTFQWSAPSGATTEDVTGLGAGNYSVTITDAFSCARTFNFTIDEPVEIGLTAVSDDVNCFAGSDGAIDLTVNNAVAPTTYMWSSNNTTQDLNNVQAGTYSVTATDANGCRKIGVYEVGTPDQIELNATINNVACYRSGQGSVILAVTGGTQGTPAYTYQWTGGTSTSDTLLVDSTGVYAVTVIDANFCRITDSFFVSQPDSMTLEANADSFVVATGYGADLEVVSTQGGNGNYQYTWTPATGLSTTTGPATTAIPENTTIYTVTAIDDNGCTATDNIKVRVDFTLVAVPDGFTPNGDMNQTYSLVTSPAVTVTEFKVFNRWGQVVSDNPNGWDGYYKGKLQPMDTYVFQAVVSLPDGKKMPYAGSFILIQ